MFSIKNILKDIFRKSPFYGIIMPFRQLLRLNLHRLRAKYDAYLATKNSVKPPILIYQMGKVGSSSVFWSLKKAKIPNYIFHIHYLSDDLPEYKKIHLDSGVFPLPYHIELSQAIRKRLRRLTNWPYYKIISLVRDPIGWQISNLFQNPNFFSSEIRDESGTIDPLKAIDLLKSELQKPDAFDYVFNWFDRELKIVFGIDVFSHPFNSDSGWGIYKGFNAEALVLRMEDLSTTGFEVISRFVNSPIKIKRVPANIRSERGSAKSYKVLKEQIKLSKSLCNRIYSSRFVKQFYNDDMLERFIQKWSGEV